MKRLSVALFVFALILLAACASEPEAVEVTRIVENEVEVTRIVEVTREVEIEVTRIITPTTLPGSVFGSPECDQFIEDIGGIAQRWDDSVQIASSTARINLSDRVAELNELRQEVRALDVPDCAAGLNIDGQAISMMDNAIEMFNLFMLDRSNDYETALYSIYQELFMDALTALKNEEGEPPNRIHYWAFGDLGFEYDYLDSDNQVRTEASSVSDTNIIKSVTLPDGLMPYLEVRGSLPVVCIILVMGEETASEEGDEIATCGSQP